MSQEHKTIACAVCGKMFVQTRITQRTCSKGCSRIRRNDQSLAWHRSRDCKNNVQKTCAICGKAFMPKPRHPTQKTCSDECKRRYVAACHREIYYRNHDRILQKRRERLATERRQRQTRGLTEEQVAEINRLQDLGDAALLRAAAAKWSKAEHAYARKRYEEINGLFPVYSGN